MTEQDQVDALYAAQATTDLERELIEALPARADPYRDVTSHAVPEQAANGAFFDCLSGQQDRNPGNVLWQEERSRIYLIDHGFSFARPGDHTGHLELTAWRWQRGSRALDDFERAAVSSLTDADLGDLRGYLAGDRADALLDRAQRLRRDREILPPGEL